MIEMEMVMEMVTISIIVMTTMIEMVIVIVTGINNEMPSMQENRRKYGKSGQGVLEKSTQKKRVPRRKYNWHTPVFFTEESSVDKFIH